MYIFFFHLHGLYIHHTIHFIYIYVHAHRCAYTGIRPVPPPTVGARGRSGSQLLNHNVTCKPSDMVQNSQFNVCVPCVQTRKKNVSAQA
jgi:hypothetical protein